MIDLSKKMFPGIFFIILFFFFNARLTLTFRPDCKLHKHRMHVAIMRGSTCLFSMQKAIEDRFRNSVSSESHSRDSVCTMLVSTSETKERFDIQTTRIGWLPARTSNNRKGKRCSILVLTLLCRISALTWYRFIYSGGDIGRRRLSSIRVSD